MQPDGPVLQAGHTGPAAPSYFSSQLILHDRYRLIQRITGYRLIVFVANLNQQLASALAESLESSGIQVLDLQPGFGATSEVLYWKSDHHLNVEGHRLAAELFADRFGEQLRMDDPVDP